MPNRYGVCYKYLFALIKIGCVCYQHLHRLMHLKRLLWCNIRVVQTYHIWPKLVLFICVVWGLYNPKGFLGSFSFSNYLKFQSLYKHHCQKKFAALLYQISFDDTKLIIRGRLILTLGKVYNMQKHSYLLVS